MSKSWAGEQELQTSLQNLSGQYPIPNSKVKSVVVIANKYVNEFKMVVYEIEKFIKKANPEDKIGGIYVLDMLCRQSGKEKDTFAKRFAIRLKETLGYVTKISSQDKASVFKVIEEWKRHNTFPSDILSSIKSEDFASSNSSSQSSGKSNNTGAGGNAASAEHSSHKERQPAESSQARASSSSTSTSSHPTSISSLKSKEEGKKEPSVVADAKKKSKDESKGKKIAKQQKEVKKAVKMCPFRDGNCPFGDKCRFNHHETNTLEQYAARLSKSIGLKRIILDDHETAIPDFIDGLLETSKREIDDHQKVDSNFGSYEFQRKKLKVDYNPSPMMPSQPTFFEINRNLFDELLLKPVS